jgi:hypothetical protein
MRVKIGKLWATLDIPDQISIEMGYKKYQAHSAYKPVEVMTDDYLLSTLHF